MVAYEELAKKFAEAEDANSHMFAEFGPWLASARLLLADRSLGGSLKKIVLDKNAVSLEKGLSTLISFYDRYEQAPR